jgi:hypothetical protein
MANEFEQDFNFVNLTQVDPNYTAIDEGVYTLKVIKMAIQNTKGNNGAEVKPYLACTFSVSNHEKFSGRRLFHNFWNVTDNSGFDAKALRRIADATGVPQDGDFRAWVEAETTQQPEFKVEVKKQQPTVWNKETKTREVKTNPDGSALPDENAINFRNVGIAG